MTRVPCSMVKVPFGQCCHQQIQEFSPGDVPVGLKACFIHPFIKTLGCKDLYLSFCISLCNVTEGFLHKDSRKGTEMGDRKGDLFRDGVVSGIRYRNYISLAVNIPYRDMVRILAEIYGMNCFLAN